MLLCECNLMFEQWLARDRDQRFGKIAEPIFEPCPLSARENDQLAHSTFSRIASSTAAFEDSFGDQPVPLSLSMEYVNFGTSPTQPLDPPVYRIFARGEAVRTVASAMKRTVVPVSEGARLK